MKNFNVGQIVTVSQSALKKALQEYQTKVSPTGIIVAMDRELITLLHSNGQKVDWKPRNLS